MSFHDDTIPYFVGALQSLENILTKAKEEGGDIPKLLEARIVADQLPLSFQVFCVTDMTAKLASRFMGTEPESLGALDTIKTFEECQKRIAGARAALEAIDKAKFDANANEIVQFDLGPERVGKLDARGYAMSYSLPNVFFHLVTAYQILRKEGITLGKMDYIMPWGISKAEITMTS